MKSYMEAYRERLEKNQSHLIQLIDDVFKIDNSVEAYIHNDPNRIIQGVVFIKDEMINSIHFHEVPYRWSGCDYTEFGNNHWGGINCDMPFNANDVIKNFQSITSVRWKYKDKHGNESVYFKNKEHYLKWCSYLKKYESSSNIHHEIQQ